MSFNLNNYETVKERKLRFYKDFPDARICVSIVNQDLDDKAVVKAEVYTCLEDQKNGCPRGEGYALELRDKELQKSNSGKQYESVNYSSWLENCEESAVGRALDNAGYASNGKPSRDEIDKASRNIQAMKSAFPSAKEQVKSLLSEAQIKRMFAIAGANGWKNNEVQNLLKEKCNISSTSELTKIQYDMICDHLQKNKPDLGNIPY